MRRRKGYCSELTRARQAATSACVSAETLRQAEERESFVVEQRKVPRVIGGCWPGEAGGGL